MTTADGAPVRPAWLPDDRLYLPLNLKRSKLTDAERAAYEGPFRPGRRGVMRVFPREIVAGRAYLREVEDGLPRLSGKTGADPVAGLRSRLLRCRATTLAEPVAGSADGRA